MTGRGTALLMVVLLGLVGYLWLVETRHRRAAPVAEAPPLLVATPDSVARVDLQDREGHLTAMRRDGSWTDAEGRTWESDAVSDLLDTLSTLRPVMVVDPEPDDVAGYGLGASAQHLQLAAGDGRPLLTLEVGERNPAWTGLYVRRTEEHQVIMVGAVLRWEIEKLRDAAPGR